MSILKWKYCYLLRYNIALWWENINGTFLATPPRTYVYENV